MAFPGSNYAPPGVYTQTLFENPLAGAIDLLKVPVFIGEGSEILAQDSLEVVRGSSSSIDQQIVSEDETGRAVVSVSITGLVTLGNYDGDLTRFQVRNFPIVSGDGSGTTTTDRSSVLATINGDPMVVMSVDGANGIVELAQAPEIGDLVRCTYFFNRTDTLITDDLSDQVTPELAVIYGQVGILDVSLGGTETFDFVTGVNDELILTVDQVALTTITFTAGSKSAAQVANVINNALLGTLSATVFVNNQGKNAILMSADQQILVGQGSANGTLGFVAGTDTGRAKVLYSFQRPVVDGSNGGITTTDTSKVTVMVNGTQVIPTALDGASGAVTLPYPPAVGATVTLTYYFNSWQDTFDYLANIGVLDITQCGVTPNRNDYIDGADFILKNDVIVWGTAFLVSSGETTQGYEMFGENQVSGLLVDNQTFLSSCTPVTDSSGAVPVTSSTMFQLPFQPTTGNGRNSPLGSSLFQTVSNNRIDLPTDRPDLVTAYWGYGSEDALQRGAVTVTAVDSSNSQITLQDAVPVGASVYASFYYNTLTDNEFTLTCQIAGVSGVGTYTVQDSGDNDVYYAHYDIGSKSAGLTGVTIVFPSGSEYTPDLRFEAVNVTSFVGPVEETVTVTFAASEATPGRYSSPGADPYFTIEDESDKLYMRVDGADLVGGAVGVDLSDPTAKTFGFFASWLGNEVEYDDSTGSTTWTIDSSNNEVDFGLDGVEILARNNETTGQTVADFVARINEASHGINGTVPAASPTGVSVITVNPAFASNIDDYYVGWEIVLVTDTSGAGFTAGQVQTVTAYVAATNEVTISGTWLPGPATNPAATDEYYLYNPATLAKYKGAAQFSAPFEIEAAANNFYDQLTINYLGNRTIAPAGASSLTATITLTPATTYSSPAALATEIQTQLDASVVFNAATIVSPQITCSADANGRIQFEFQRAAQDNSGGVFAFVVNASLQNDFAAMAGLDTTGTFGQDSVHVLHGPVSYHYTVGAGALLYDRMVVRNRITPGGNAGSMWAYNAIEQSELAINAASGNDILGLETDENGQASSTATVKAATLVGVVGLASGQHDGSIGAATRGEPAVIFYDGTGVEAANNELDFVVDGTPVQTVFVASSTGTNTPLASGSATYDPLSVLGQIEASMAALPGTPFGSLANIQTARLVLREGLGWRLTSNRTDANSRVQITEGSANSVLGMTDNSEAIRTDVDVREIVSALQNHAVIAGSYSDLFFGPAGGAYGTAGPGSATYFAGEALAGVIKDAAGAEYLYTQSQTVGTSSSIEFRNASSADALRYGTGLLIENQDGGNGEAASSGYYVTSTNVNGSGSSNTSVFNSGTGQDGFVGQTYRDEVTGLTFSILPRTGNVPYPTAAASFNIEASKTWLTDANIPVTTLPGMDLTVANTYNVNPGDTAIVETFERGGNEPSVGQIYYVSYTYSKQDFSPAIFTKLSIIEQAYGGIDPENPLTFASYLALLNGSIILVLDQVPRAEGSSQASLTSYRDAIDELEGALPGQIYPDIITPLRSDSTDLYLYLSQHDDIQSSIRYRAERTSIIGANAGTDEEAVISLAKTLGSTRMRLCYPDSLLVPVTDALGVTREYLVAGQYLASMMVGNRTSPNIDPATPWTSSQLVGSNGFGRKLDIVEQNQVAVNGVTVFDHLPPFLRCRHGLTTDMSNILTKTPTIIQIADYVQIQSRSTLENFIGVKFLPGILSQVEGRLAQLFKAMVRGQIVSAYTGIKATPELDNPTAADVEGYYQPVFPLLYLVLTYHLRSQLNA